jgi:heme-degrading monooxygenase HmoA
MIARTWRGAVRPRDAEEYVEYLRRTGFAGLGSTPGNVAVLGLRRMTAEAAEFIVMSLWESEAAIEGFAGPEPLRAVFYPEDRRFLIERDEHVDHFEVVHLSGPPENTGAGEPKGLLRRLVEWWLRGGVAMLCDGAHVTGVITPRGFTYVRLP